MMRPRRAPYDLRPADVSRDDLGAGTRRPHAGIAAQGANDRVRVAVIGTGGRARGLMTLLKKLPGNEMVAVCDVYEPNLLQAAEIAGADATKVADYRRILDSREIDAVVIGTPDHWHKTITLDAVAAGKDVYVEKPVSHTIAEGVELVKAVEASKQVVQTGTQQRSWEHWVLGKQLIDAGKLGTDHLRPDLLVSARDAPATTRRSRWTSSIGSAGSVRRRTSRFVRSASISGGTSGTSAAAA